VPGSGADALVDVTNSPSFEADAVMAFFTTSAGDLVEAGRRAGVGHYVALSIVGVDRLQTVVVDAEARYFGALLDRRSLVTPD
jgi:uncharacterized protein YbjT (DUF2867 family)